MGLLDYRLEYKDANAHFEYPEAYKFFEKQNMVHWVWTEVPMGRDVQDWKMTFNCSREKCCRKYT
jgi:ribonucleotide reductase beta subunit family protein with ferritin-like domain